MFDKYRATNIVKIFFEQYHKYKILIKHRKEDDYLHEEDYKVESLINIFVEPTNHCNFNCEFCARESMARKKGLINYEAFVNTIDLLREGSYLTLTGNGEPLLNPHIYKMIRYATDRGMFVSVITNASPLNARNRKRLIESGVSRVQISFQSIDKATNEKIMSGSNFERDLLNILEFVYDVRKSKAKIYISIGMVDYSATKRFASLTKKFWNKIPVDNYYEGALLSLQTDSKVYELCSRVEEPYVPCANPWAIAKVNVDGSVNICPQDFFNRYPIGNIHDAPLSEILNSDKATQLRKAVLIGDFDFLNKIGYSCDKCNAWTHEVTHGIEDFIYKHLPIHMSLVINEIACDKPSNTIFLEKIINMLKNGQTDLVNELKGELSEC